jgi:hypothetical protein
MKTSTALACVFTVFLCSSPLPLPAAALDLGSPTSRTPYDSYFGPRWDVLRRLGNTQPDIAQVEQLVRQGKGFRYYFNRDQPYTPQTPEQTESSRSGDCKAKSLWLAAKMDTRKVRFVVGKAKQFPNVSHAWLIWDGPQGWLILDATLFSRPLNPERLSAGDFVPRYSYSPSGKFSHAPSAAAPGSKYGDHL